RRRVLPRRARRVRVRRRRVRRRRVRVRWVRIRSRPGCRVADFPATRASAILAVSGFDASVALGGFSGCGVLPDLFSRTPRSLNRGAGAEGLGGEGGGGVGG